MKKLLALLLALVMLLALGACAGGGETPTATPAAATKAPSPSTGTDAPDETDPPEEDVLGYPIVTDGSITLTWFLPSNPKALSTYEDLSQNYSYSQITAHTGINIKFDAPAMTAAAEQFALMMTSGDYTDLCTRDYTGGGDTAIADEVYLRLNELMDQYAPDYMAILNSDPNNLRDATTDTGNRWRFCQLTEGLQLAFQGFTIRKDWLDELGITELPRTYDQLHDVLAQFRDNYVEGPFALFYKGITNYNSFNGAFGVASYDRNFYFVQNDGKAVCSIGTENFRDYLRLAKQWYDEKLIDPNFFSHHMTAGQVDFDIMFNNRIGLIEGQQTGTYYADKGMAPEGAYFEPLYAPVKNLGDERRIGLNSSIVSGYGTAITTACAVPEIATRFLNFFYTDQGYIDGNFGTEGVTFNYDDKGNPVLTEMLTAPVEMSVWDAYCTYIIGVGSMRYCWHRNDTPETLANRAITDERWADNGLFPDNMPINLAFTVEEGAERSSILTDLDTYVQTATVNFITGVNDIDADWQDYIDTLDTIGMERITEIYQNSLDRYYAR